MRVSVKSNDARAVQNAARGETASVTQISAKRQPWRVVEQHPREAKQTPTCQHDCEPMDETLKAVARLIAEGATMATIDRNFTVICNLLHRECYWNDDAVYRLGKSPIRQLRRRDTSTVVAMPAPETPAPPG